MNLTGLINIINTSTSRHSLIIGYACSPFLLEQIQHILVTETTIANPTQGDLKFNAWSENSISKLSTDDNPK
jgi:hypothetical protein